MSNVVIEKVSVLGSDEQIQWEHTDEGLKIRTPFSAPNKSAIVFEIKMNDLNGLDLADEAEEMDPITIDG
jgi:alpha-L-fucosidase